MTTFQDAIYSSVGAVPQDRKRRILIADDDEPTRRMLAEYLEQEGYQVQLAADGKQALEAASSDFQSVYLGHLYVQEDEISSSWT
jgi:DNA-binding NtrC family response regulator